MSGVLARWNRMTAEEAENEILPCCGSGMWAQLMLARRPFESDAALLNAAEEIWRNLDRSGWAEAFASHPRIGETRAAKPSHVRSATWSVQEQRDATITADDVKIALADANREYEKRFNRIFIVYATGKTAPEILEILRRRLRNDSENELRETVEQQGQIIGLRIRKWLSE